MAKHSPMTRRQYRALADELPTNWLLAVLARPTEIMTLSQRAIVALVLRRRGVPSFQKGAV